MLLFDHRTFANNRCQSPAFLLSLPIQFYILQYFSSSFAFFNLIQAVVLDGKRHRMARRVAVGALFLGLAGIWSGLLVRTNFAVALACVVGVCLALGAIALEKVQLRKNVSNEFDDDDDDDDDDSNKI